MILINDGQFTEYSNWLLGHKQKQINNLALDKKTISDKRKKRFQSRQCQQKHFFLLPTILSYIKLSHLCAILKNLCNCPQCFIHKIGECLKKIPTCSMKKLNHFNQFACLLQKKKHLF